jgi:hypothetical protein
MALKLDDLNKLEKTELIIEYKKIAVENANLRRKVFMLQNKLRFRVSNEYT